MPLLENLLWNSNIIRIDSESPAIILPLLHTLTVEKNEFIETDSDDDDPPQFPNLRVPNLTKLKIIGRIREIRSLLSITHSSRCVLKCIELRDTSFSYIQQAIEGFSDIEELQLYDIDGSHDIFLQKLIRNPTGNVETIQLLPSLQRLELRPRRPYTPNEISSMMDIMRSRTFLPTFIVQEKNTSAVHLSHLKLTGKIYREIYDTAFIQLLNLGKELGIKVELDVAAVPYS
ncbi:hypothetical protein BDQ17DRAFT_1433325 [Cyathus striatus]|nr:hypothetical protein BDQ17DRAFT_1433325 [Cyathus striatus]